MSLTALPISSLYPFLYFMVCNVPTLFSFNTLLYVLLLSILFLSGLPINELIMKIVLTIKIANVGPLLFIAAHSVCLLFILLKILSPTNALVKVYIPP
jgi:hypothetical protein